MIWFYIALGASVALNIGLGIAYWRLSQKHYHTAKQLRWYNLCARNRGID